MVRKNSESCEMQRKTQKQKEQPERRDKGPCARVVLIEKGKEEINITVIRMMLRVKCKC